jgi:hypothetical protein
MLPDIRIDLTRKGMCCTWTGSGGPVGTNFLVDSSRCTGPPKGRGCTIDPAWSIRAMPPPPAPRACVYFKLAAEGAPRTGEVESPGQGRGFMLWPAVEEAWQDSLGRLAHAECQGFGGVASLLPAVSKG